jgi:hypothetical protein
MPLLVNMLVYRLQPALVPTHRNGNGTKHFVAKLDKGFGHLGDASESLDDFRYTKI